MNDRCRFCGAILPPRYPSQPGRVRQWCGRQCRWLAEIHRRRAKGARAVRMGAMETTAAGVLRAIRRCTGRD